MSKPGQKVIRVVQTSAKTLQESEAMLVKNSEHGLLTYRLWRLPNLSVTLV